MDVITHRVLRNQSAEVLRRVATGESLAITNHGDVAALIVPAPTAAIEQARAAGESTPARVRGSFAALTARPGPAVADILADLRGDR